MTLIESIHKEMDRCRELLKEYEMIPTGFFGATIIKQGIKNAEKFIEEGDVVKMLLAYEELKKIEG